MTYGRGLLPSAVEKTAHRFGAALHRPIAVQLMAGPKGHADLSPLLDGIVFNQERCSGCWAHAASLAFYGAHAGAGKKLAAPPSPLYFMQSMYATDRARATKPGADLPLLIDTGAELQDAADVFAKLGEVPLQAPQQGGDTDVPATEDGMGNAIPVPELVESEVARGMLATFDGEYSIDPGVSAPQLLMASLDAGIFVWDGFLVDQACEQLGPTDILGAPVGRGIGGHSTLYWGYDLNATRAYPVDGPVFFKRNSWGRAWCRNGDYTVDSRHVAAAWALWPFAVTVPA